MPTVRTSLIPVTLTLAYESEEFTMRFATLPSDFRCGCTGPV